MCWLICDACDENWLPDGNFAPFFTHSLSELLEVNVSLLF